MREQKKGYAVIANTGCSCDSCQQESFIELYFTDEPVAAMTACESHEKHRTLKSQYSNTGIYNIKEFEYKQTPDGRKIIGNFITDGNDEKHETRFNSVVEFNFVENQLGDSKTLATYGSYLPQEKW